MFKWLEQYFTFTKGERNAIIALVLLSVILLIAPRVYFYFKPVEHETDNKYLKQVEIFSKQYHDSSEVVKNSGEIDSGAIPVKRISAQYFNFDPNKIGVPEWVKLGFTEKQAITIEHYKAKGAKFYTPQDLKRLFVMSDNHYEALLPYVKIDKDALPQRTYRHND